MNSRCFLTLTRLLAAVPVAFMLCQPVPAQNGLAGPPVLSGEPVAAFAAAVAELSDGVVSKTEVGTEEFAALDNVGESDGTVLINGEIVDSRSFPAIFRKTGGSNCTAALIGPATMLTAAHCVQHGETLKFSAGQRSTRGVCEQAPGYQAGTKSEDWALCLLENEVRGIPYENVELTRPTAAGTPIFLTGFGCTATAGPADPQQCRTGFAQGDRTLRIGLTKVAPRPGLFATRTNTLFSDSSATAGAPILCPGDSGGPAFIIPNGDRRAVRRLVGVNSATCLLGDRAISLVASTASAPGAAFIRDWVRRRGQTVCGVNGSALPNCAF